MGTHPAVTSAQDPDMTTLCRSFGESSPLPMAAVTGPGHTVCFVNTAFCLLTGKTRDELVGSTFCAGASLGDDCAASLDQVSKSGLAQTHTGQVGAAAHPLFWSYAMWPLVASDGHAMGVLTQVTETAAFHQQSIALSQALLIGSVRQHELKDTADALNEQLLAEIVERKEVEAKLKESEARYRTLFDLAPVAVYSCDASGALRDFNPCAEELWGRRPMAGYPNDRFCGSYKMFRPDGVFIPRELGPMADVLAGKMEEVRDMEVKIERPDGSRVTAAVNIRVVKNEDGQITGAINCLVDITERQRQSEEIRQASERFRFLAESMPQKISTASPAGGADYFNRQWLEYSGFTFDEIKGWGWQQLLHPEDLAEGVRHWQSAVDTGEPLRIVQRFRRADGMYRWHLSLALAMRDGAGEISMWIASNTDIHEERIKEVELRRMNEDLQQFAFAASHDLREPLRSISVYTQLLVQSYRGDLGTAASEYMKFITSGIKHMESLLADLLSYTQLNSDERDQDLVDLNTVLQNVQLTLQRSRDESGAVVTCGDLPIVRGYAARYFQLFQNLIGNAIKYRGLEAPHINVTAEERKGEWLFSVSDNGMGIQPEYHLVIFGVFKRLHGSAIPGTGIGLAICQRVVERYGGRIWVESEPGRGSTFYFTLPSGASPNS